MKQNVQRRTSLGGTTLSMRILPLLALALTAWAADPATSASTSEWKFEKNVATFEARDRETPPPTGAIAFIGSSTFTMWKSVATDMAPLPVYNRGFGGSAVQDQIRAAPRILLPHKPAVVVYYCGDNNIVNEKGDPQAVLKGFKDFHALLRKELPATRIVHVGIKPSIKRKSAWPKAQQANALVREFAASDPLITCVDPASVLLDDKGEIKPGIYTKDDLHLNAEGYVLMTGLIKPAVEKAWAAATAK